MRDFFDLSLADHDCYRQFDGNGQNHIGLWLWMMVKHFTDEDYKRMAQEPDLDWVIIPMDRP